MLWLLRAPETRIPFLPATVVYQRKHEDKKNKQREHLEIIDRLLDFLGGEQ
jgi:hypothetical protein